jgi:hypothetical protein
MTLRNNTRFKVVFLIALVFTLISACTLPTANNQHNRPSSKNEDNEERQPQATATSLPTHTTTKNSIRLISISKIPSSSLLPLTAILGGAFYVSIPHRLRNASIGRSWEHLDADFFRSTMELRLIIDNDNRTNTIGTFAPYDSTAI